MSDRSDPWTRAMRAGRFEDAWALSEAALARRDPATRDDPALPYHQRWVWDGRPFDGRDVLVRCYHGLGDAIQFARFLPALAARAASLSVEAPARLHGLLAGVTGIDRLIAFDPARPASSADCDLEFGELAFALRMTPGDAPPPYLRAAPAPLPPGTIGLCYAGGDWDAERSIPPALLAPLCAGRTCLSLVAAPAPLPALNPEGCPFDMDETAALVAGCALVVSVDTMVAHLAGALGRPTRLLLKAEPDWRWTPGARTTPWYPAMRIHAQPRPGDWGAVVAGLERDLLGTRR